MTRAVLGFGGSPPDQLIETAANVVVVAPEECYFIQLVTAFDIVWIDWSAVDTTSESICRAVLHSAVQHLRPDGLVLVSTPAGSAHQQLDTLTPQLELTLVETRHATDGAIELTYQRTGRFTIHDLVRAARTAIRRIDPQQLASEQVGDHPPTVLDTRTPTDRQRFGVIPGSLHVPRTILEWSLDPSNGYRNAAITSLDQRIVVVCNGGYSSSLAAANLLALGFTEVADLIGGHHGWVRAGLPVEPPDHWSLDY
jgi:rhodanese-related sulfurtransferase